MVFWTSLLGNLCSQSRSGRSWQVQMRVLARHRDRLVQVWVLFVHRAFFEFFWCGRPPLRDEVFHALTPNLFHICTSRCRQLCDTSPKPIIKKPRQIALNTLHMGKQWWCSHLEDEIVVLRTVACAVNPYVLCVCVFLPFLPII